MSAIHQFVPSLVQRDAIGAHSLQVRELLRSRGYRSEIFAGDFAPELASECHPYLEFARARQSGDTRLMYQASIGSPMADFLMERPEPKLLNFHNITPAHLIQGWEPRVVDEVAVGRLQLARLATVAEAGIAVSSFNEAELKEAGFARTRVAPLLVDLEAFDQVVDGRALARLEAAKRRGGADLLFVGRLLPSKAQHDLIKLLAAYRERYDPAARLHLVGADTFPTYRAALERFVGDLGLGEAVDFAGSVPAGLLAAHYRSADVFVCCSDHEGFCIPLLEAMHHDVPVVAFAAAAVPETVAGAGLLLGSKDPSIMAAAVHRVVNDPDVRQAMIESGRERVGDHQLACTRARFAEVVEELVGPSR